MPSLPTVTERTGASIDFITREWRVASDRSGYSNPQSEIESVSEKFDGEEPQDANGGHCDDGKLEMLFQKRFDCRPETTDESSDEEEPETSSDHRSEDEEW
mgnify:CR=1 FL=1